jgi:hypothetical protein
MRHNWELLLPIMLHKKRKWSIDWLGSGQSIPAAASPLRRIQTAASSKVKARRNQPCG